MREQSELARQALDDLTALPSPARPRTESPGLPPDAVRPTRQPQKQTFFGYVGKGTYRRKAKGERKKISIYLSPPAASALRQAAATGEDPRGASMGEIVESLLYANGYV